MVTKWESERKNNNNKKKIKKRQKEEKALTNYSNLLYNIKPEFSFCFKMKQYIFYIKKQKININLKKSRKDNISWYSFIVHVTWLPMRPPPNTAQHRTSDLSCAGPGRSPIGSHVRWEEEKKNKQKKESEKLYNRRDKTKKRWNLINVWG